ncbi:hypothetical protein [Leptospira inadai]|nr:hypothetical protein [Leptospira inadai]
MQLENAGSLNGLDGFLIVTTDAQRSLDCGGFFYPANRPDTI